MLNLQELKTTAQTNWKWHDTLPTYHQAFCMIGFYKNQGYQCVKILQCAANVFEIYVLIKKGA